MARQDLLPGITFDNCPPKVVIESRRAVRRARQRAALRDAAQLVLLAAVDYLFVRWPLAHIPSLGRDASVLTVAALNALLLTQTAVSRVFPLWSARRIAATWCVTERTRFFEAHARQKARQ